MNLKYILLGVVCAILLMNIVCAAVSAADVDNYCVNDTILDESFDSTTLFSDNHTVLDESSDCESDSSLCSIDDDFIKNSESVNDWNSLNNALVSNASEINIDDDINFSSQCNISSSLVINGHNHVLNGQGVSGIFYISPFLNVTLKNLTIINGYSLENGAGVKTENNVHLTLVDCVFKNNKVYNANGAALSTGLYCNVEFQGCVFENNTSVRESDLKWEEFKRGMGSVIYAISGTTLNITKSKFIKNNAYLSTILLVSYYKDTVLNTSNLYVDNCCFDNNTSKSHGAIYLDEFGRGIISNSDFTNNFSPDGGTILVLDACPYAIVKNCSFINNYGNVGGAVLMKLYNGSFVCNAVISDCNFINNSAPYGGAVNLQTGCNLEIFNSSFKNNSAKNNGGSIYCHESSTLSVFNSSFNNNVAVSGGAIYSSKAELNIYNSSFINNMVNESAGAIRVTSGGNSKLNINNSYFNSNHAEINGGAIYSTVKTDLDNSRFDSNGADCGGAIYMANGKNSVLNCYNLSFSNNNAGSNGSAVYSVINDFNRVTIQKSAFNNDSLWILKDDVESACLNHIDDILIRKNSTILNVNYSGENINRAEAFVVESGEILTVENNIINIPVSNYSEGDYTIKITAFDKNNNSVSEYFICRIRENIAYLIVDVADIVYPNAGVVFVSGDVDGLYVVSVCDMEYNVTVCDGKGNVTLDVLSAGNYIVNVSGNTANYTVVSNTVIFTVAGMDTNVSVNIPDISVGKTASIPVNLPSNATGNVSVIVDGIVMDSKALVNGSADLNVSNLSAGQHNISIFYTGDGKYRAFNQSRVLNVKTDNNSGGKLSTILSAKNKVIFKASKCSTTKSFKFTLISNGVKVNSVTVFFKLDKKVLKSIKAKSKKAKKILKQLKKGTYGVKTKGGVARLKLLKSLFVFKKGKGKITATFKGGARYLACKKVMSITLK